MIESLKKSICEKYGIEYRSGLDFCLEHMRKYPEEPYISPKANIDWNCTKVGDGCTIMAGANVGWPGFGFQWDGKRNLHIPHSGRCVLGKNVWVFPGVNIARGTVKATYIGDGTAIDGNVHIGHNARIGKNCLLTAGVVIGGSCVIGDRCYFGVNSTVQDHITIAEGVYIGAGSNVTKDCDKPYWVYYGNPARPVRPVREEDY